MSHPTTHSVFLDVEESHTVRSGSNEGAFEGDDMMAENETLHRGDASAGLSFDVTIVPLPAPFIRAINEQGDPSS
jgi:hypothetical protein